MEGVSGGFVATWSPRARSNPRETHLLTRGDFLKPDQVVSPGVPAFLHPVSPEDAPPTRLTFAQWLVDRRSPTTARAIVNRIWQTYFGTGLVNTSEDLGTRCEAPSHPELLDWLAVELMDSGWSLKHLHRLIVDSATYRQSSRMTPELLERDPDNQLLARGPRFRVDAEKVRDIALSASGLLNPKIGGPVRFRRCRNFCSSRRSATGQNPGRRRQGRTDIGGRCTRSVSARCRIRRCRHSMRPPANRLRSPTAIEHAAAGAGDVE